MVHCSKCGAKNPDDAAVCTQCGATLETGTYPERRREEECFGLPRGGAIWGIVVGLIIILAGISWLLGFEFWKIFWPLIVIIFGILVLVGSLYGLRHRR